MIYDSTAKRLGTGVLIHKDKIKIDMTGIRDRNNPEGTKLSQSGLTVKIKLESFTLLLLKIVPVFSEPQ